MLSGGVRISKNSIPNAHTRYNRVKVTRYDTLVYEVIMNPGKYVEWWGSK